MDPVELRDLDAARQFVLQGLRLQRAVPVTTASVRTALEWALTVAASGQPLPSVGFVADLGHVLLGADREFRPSRSTAESVGLPGGLARAYEDFVLGKCYADPSVERAGDVIRRLPSRDQGRAIAFVAQQFRERADFGGVLLSPAVIKGLMEVGPEDVASRGWEALQRTGLMPLLADLYASLVAGARRTSDVLSPEDVFELEHGTALADLSQRIALRQVLAMASWLHASVRDAVRVRHDRSDVPAHVLDEDTYPVGGFASLSTRGTIESLLHSQLAYMEQGSRDGPDLFDIKFVRDELLYYSRDENQLLRRRLSFAFVFASDLAQTRFKDRQLPAQRMILALALAVAAVHSLSACLGNEALHFELLFPSQGDSAPLAQEHALMKMLFREAIANGMVRLTTYQDVAGAAAVCDELAQRSECRTLAIGATEWAPNREGWDHCQLIISGPRPRLLIRDDVIAFDELDDSESWNAALRRLLDEWLLIAG
jgi:hypothetical protein